MTLGQKLTPILKELEDVMWEHHARYENSPLEFDDGAFRSAMKIFMTLLTEEMWKAHGKDAKAQEAGLAVRLLVKEFTGINTHKLYKDGL